MSENDGKSSVTLRIMGLEIDGKLLKDDGINFTLGIILILLEKSLMRWIFGIPNDFVNGFKNEYEE